MRTKVRKCTIWTQAFGQLTITPTGTVITLYSNKCTLVWSCSPVSTVTSSTLLGRPHCRVFAYIDSGGSLELFSKGISWQLLCTFAVVDPAL